MASAVSSVKVDVVGDVTQTDFFKRVTTKIRELESTFTDTPVLRCYSIRTVNGHAGTVLGEHLATLAALLSLCAPITFNGLNVWHPRRIVYDPTMSYDYLEPEFLSNYERFCSVFLDF